MLHYDPLKSANHLHKAVLILQGGKDYQVTQKDFSLWKQHFKNNPQAVFHFYPTLNHLFMECKGTPSPESYHVPGHVAPQVIHDIVCWVKNNFENK